MKTFKKLYIFSLLFPYLALADGVAIDKVYHPYVHAQETEIESRMISAGDNQLYRLGVGQSLSERVFIEGYLITGSSQDTSSIRAFEIEALFQLTEQGEYAADWGLIIEIENNRRVDTWELATGLLMERQWGKWIGTANVHVIYEWGDKISSEFESSLASQIRYRYARYFEPAIEFYSSESGQALGPVLTGDIRFRAAKKLHWEIGALAGLGSKVPDTNFRLLLEYEF